MRTAAPTRNPGTRRAIAAATTATLALLGGLLSAAPAHADEDTAVPLVTASNISVTSSYNGADYDVHVAYDAAFADTCTYGQVNPVVITPNPSGFDDPAYRVQDNGWVDVTASGANTVDFTLPAAGTYQLGMFTAVNAAGSCDVTSDVNPTLAGTADFTVVAPVTRNETAPTISGTATVGKTLTATPGTYWPGTAVVTYQWNRNGAPIAGATNLAYALSAADSKTKVTVTTTGADEQFGSASATSAAVTVQPGTITAFTPTITGTKTVGQTLTAVTPAGLTYTYQWYRGSSKISGATGRTYKLVTADGGTTVKVAVVGSKSGYTSLTRTSASTSTIVKLLTATPTPKITGTVKVGYKLTAVASTWAPATVSLKYQWYRDGAAISGATGSTYTVAGSSAGKRITVKVTGAKTGYATVAKTSKSTAAVAKGTITMGAPKISGTVKVGYTLTAARASSAPTTGVTYKYQWYLNGAAVSGATSSKLGLKTSMQGKQVQVRVTASATGYGTLGVSSAKTVAVAAAASAIKGDGTYRVGIDVKAGTYYTASTTNCYWERSSSSRDIIDNNFGSGRQMVTISATDKYFESDRCGAWYRYDGTGKNASSFPGDGMYAVGVDVRPGTYKSSGGNGGWCYIASLSTLSGGYDDIIDNDGSGSGTKYWEVHAGEFVDTSGCGTWTRVSN
ncbi:hypothetical protein [Leifsonia sp. Leaf264]|uniref:hypothetical protein n=1 Tax=Leifsonia sp. Leaf264 TaxID=1736314 RepID=UPI0007005EE3|nr:hypothetical protein [Leifsonia sp. Leaf264]KQO98619.1 hypothetical protein ASF30_11190 [Leifsonia sp. Leaf264]